MRFLLALLALSCSPLFLATASEKPNILLIMADDLGFSDLGCYGGEIETPRLDALAENGLRFTQFYNTARCWPTRGALLTGYYAQQIRRDTLPGVPSGGGNRGIRPDWAPLLPKMLQPQGYRSYHIGKWHIDGMPVEQGFDRSYYLRDQGRFFNPTRHWLDDEPLPAVEKDSGFYATIALADHLIAMLDEHEQDHADQPFFAYLAFAAPHFPLHALPEDIALYRERYRAGWDAIREERFESQRKLGLLDVALSPPEPELGPPYHFPEALEILGDGEVNRPVPWETLTDEQQDFQADKMAIHAAMIHRMDIEIGRVLDRIDAMGETEDTLVIFLSDNGASAEIMVRDDGHDPDAPRGSAATYLCLGPGWSTTSNTPFRRHKTWTHEGGIATPFILSWPEGIAARGEIRRTPGHVIDVVPTLLQLTGATAAENVPPSPGRSLVPLFEKDEGVTHDSLWWFHDGHKAVRQGDWKAVASESEPWELYRLDADRTETNDLAEANPDKLEELVALWQTHLDAFVELASRDLPEDAGKGKGKTKARPGAGKGAGKGKGAPRKQVLFNGETFDLGGRRAFLMKPGEPAEGNPWIFYAPTLPAYPDSHESWMHRQFLEAGVAVAGIDVGEAYGSPKAFPAFESLYEEMDRRGFAEVPAALGRSRGGLWASSWAISQPGRVAAIGGIYPVYDYTIYPGVKRAADAYGATPADLDQRQDDWNPIRRGAVLAEAEIPVFIIHGEIDEVVPIAENSGALETIYAEAGQDELFDLIRIPRQGHNFWPEFFQCQPLVDFLIEHAKAAAR